MRYGGYGICITGHQAARRHFSENYIIMKKRYYLIIALVGAGLGLTPAAAAPTTVVDLGTAASYTILSGASIGNTVSAPGAPHTTIRGDLGVKANTAPTGFPPGVVTGAIRFGAPVDGAHADAVAAYNEIALRTGGEVIAGALVGAVLTPGLYRIAGAASNTGTLTLNGGGDPDAVFVFQVDGALSFAAISHVVLTNEARASRVFWQVNGAGAIGAGSTFAGTMIALNAVAIGNGTLVNGRAIAITGALTLDNNEFYGAPPVVTIDGGGIAYTTDTTPTLTGTTDVDAPGEVSVTIAGQTLTAVPVDGLWSVTSGILPNNVYPVVASVTDAAGNPGTATQSLTVDTVLPLITLDGGASMTTNSSTPTISGTSDVDTNTVVRITIHSQALNALVHGDESWNIRAASLVDGTYEVTATVSDLAGNESVAIQSITIDSTPPSVAISGGPNATTNDLTPVLTGFANVAPGTMVEVIVGNQTLYATVDDEQLWSVTPEALSDGLHRFIVIVEDAAGNVTRREHVLTIDTYVAPAEVGPSITSLSVSPRKVSLSGRDKNSLGRLGPMIILNLSGKASVRFRITGKISRAITFTEHRPGGEGFTRIPRKSLKHFGRGGYRVSAVATDADGRISEVKQAAFRVIR